MSVLFYHLGTAVIGKKGDKGKENKGYAVITTVESKRSRKKDFDGVSAGTKQRCQMKQERGFLLGGR